MKSYLRTLIAASDNKLTAVHLVREYLQARILQSLQRAGAMQTLAFHGGTSLRFLYNIPRYSEDLDFARELQPDQYDFRAYLQRIQRDFSAEAYEIDVKINDKRVVHKAFIRFRGLLHELGLSGHKTEVLAIKIEVDTNPPAHAGLMTTPVEKHILLHLLHHDPSTLLAGKLHAILQREYTKGRDIYDLWWYLALPAWPAPNLAHLNANLLQSGWSDEAVTEQNWKGIVRERIQPLSWPQIMNDVGPFIMTADEAAEFSKAHLLRLLA
jgi:predicted nucleotidyltransferase component of viral defense system